MNMQFCGTNALIKWLKTDLTRLSAATGQQVGGEYRYQRQRANVLAVAHY
jgi:hypothetical protein